MLVPEAPMPVRVEKLGPVTTVILDRPDGRNAVDRVSPPADGLAGHGRPPRGDQLLV
jgi:hypothetical protein